MSRAAPSQLSACVVFIGTAVVVALKEFYISQRLLSFSTTAVAYDGKVSCMGGKMQLALSIQHLR